MPFVNITLNIGAAMNCYKLIWNYQYYFSNVVIHLGHFHVSKENFLIISIIIQASGFEDLAFQVGICTSGSIKSILSGSHYNSMDSSQYFLEALEHLLFKNFLKETKSEMPDSIKRAAMIDPNEFNSSDCKPVQTLL